MKRLLLTTALVLGAYVPSAFGYQYITAGCGNLNFGSGHMGFYWANNLTAAETTAIKRGTDRATQFSDSSISYLGTVAGPWNTNNGRNEVFKDPTHGTAYCSYWYNTSSCAVTQADIAFGDEPWVTTEGYNTYNFGAFGRSMTGTAVHEGGHCVGMGHENRYYNMMGADYSHLGWDGIEWYYGPGEDMSHGLINLHGKKSATDANRDVGVTVMRYNAPSGEYSTHKYGVLRDTSGTELPVVGTYSGQRVYRVAPGQTVRVEYTAENNGEQNSESPVALDFRLSTNDIISAGDTLIGSTSWTLGRGLPAESYSSVTIPSSTLAGNYFLGMIIDGDYTIPEVTSGNNYAYYPITVVGGPDLIVSAFSRSPTSLPVGGTLSMSATVRNQGTGTSAATTLRYFRSTDATITTVDTQVCTDAVSGLAPSGTSAQSCSVTVPTTPGTYYYGACVNSVSGESNTGNNCSPGYAVTVTSAAVLCQGVTATIVGTAGNDTITGTAGNDVIQGLGGNDIIRGGGGSDRICGGAGSDTLYGEAGNDTLFGEGGPDRLVGGSGTSDYCNGGLGSDTASTCETRVSIP